MIVVAASGLIGLIVRPRRAGTATQVMAVGLAMVAVAPIVGDPDNLGGQASFVDPLVVAVALPVLAAGAVASPWRVWVRSGLQRPSLLWLGLLGLPMIWFGVEQALLQRNTWPPLADPHHQAHWMVMSQLAFATPLIAVGGSMLGRGWRLACAVAALGSLAVAIPSLIDGEAASAVAPGVALAVVLWAVALIGVTLRNQHQSQPRPRT